MAKLFLGVRIPNRAYERLLIENVDFEQSVLGLRDQIAKKLDVPKEEIELLYCGNVLEDDEKISDLNIKPNTTIHVLKKTTKAPNYSTTATFTDTDCQRIADTFMEVTGTQINVQSRMNILQKILDEYPEFRRNLGAQALIRDSVLFNSLDKYDVIKKVSQNYPLICDAADFIVKTVKKEITKNYIEHTGSSLAAEELFSDLTSGSEEETSAQSNSEQARIRRISRDQLAAALSQVGSASLNSLSNIAQRNTNANTDNSASTSTSLPSGTSSSPVRISSSLLNNALRNALLSATAGQTQDSTRTEGIETGENQSSVSMDTSEVANQGGGGSSELNNAIQRNLFESELQIMHEVGLTDDTINLQALILARGEVEEAINFVYMWNS